jgi:ribosomal protein S18 acetylase RimI-like enzyme
VEVIEYAESAHAAGMSAVLRSLGWEQRYIDGQLGAVARLASSSDGCVYVATADGHVIGYVSAVLARWNMLGQLHRLALDPAARRGGMARALVTTAEDHLRSLVPAAYTWTPQSTTCLAGASTRQSGSRRTTS